MTTDILFLHLSYLLTLIALTVREIFWLRIILTLSQFGHLTHAYINQDINKSGWTIIFILINFIQIIIIMREKKELHIPEQILDIYKKVAENVLAIPVLTGLKSESERFAGAMM